MKLRVIRLQEFLNAVHQAGLLVDGNFGLRTMGGVEDALDVDDWASEPKPFPGSHHQFDDRTEENLAALDPKAEPILRRLVGLAIDDIGPQHGVVIKVISGHRTWAQQDALYAKGRRGRQGPHIVTKARGGHSNHNFGIAIDFGVFNVAGRYLDGGSPDEKQLAAKVHGAIAAGAKKQNLGTEWGGDWRWRDFPHHEVKAALSMIQKREAYLRRGSVL